MNISAKIREPGKLPRKKAAMPRAYLARLDAKTDDEVLAAARADPDAMPVEDYPPGRLGPPRRVPLARAIRFKLGLSQADFADTFHIPLGTLRDWEQHRREPDRAARAYLEVIAREPDAVRRALAKPAPPARRAAKVSAPVARSAR